jgi:hypothetical protein
MYVVLGQEVDPRALDVFEGVPGLRLATGAPQSAIVTDKDLIPVEVNVVDVEGISGYFERPAPTKPLLLAINAILDSRTAAHLEDMGINYVDAAGRFWARGEARTTYANSRQIHRGRQRLSAPAVRLSQLLADHPFETWSERGLATRGRSTQATVHRLFVRLDREGVIRREGKGRGALTRVGDPLTMRYWLAREARPRSARVLSCFLREPHALPDLPGRSFALTGAAGAAALNMPVATETANPMFRVNVNNDELEGIPEALGGFRTTEGANVTLIADPDRLAFVDRDAAAARHFTAPPSRIMLDLFLEPRGEATVGVFLDLWGDRELQS